MKKLISLILCSLLLFSLVACEKNQEESITSEEDTTSETTTQTATTTEPEETTQSAINLKEYNALFPVYVDGYAEFIDKTGKVVTDYKFDNADFMFDATLSLSNDKGKIEFDFAKKK